MVISRSINEDDLFVLVSARKGSASYMGVLEYLPAKLEKHFANNSRLVVYPQQFNQNYGSERYDDITAVPLNKGIKTIQKIGKGIGNIFKKNELE